MHSYPRHASLVSAIYSTRAASSTICFPRMSFLVFAMKLVSFAQLMMSHPCNVIVMAEWKMATLLERQIRTFAPGKNHKDGCNH